MILRFFQAICMKRIKLIAEIGVNHNGKMSIAKKLIKKASMAGADYAKFQTWSVKNLKPGPWDNDGRKEIYQKAELTKEMKSFIEFLTEKKNEFEIK